VLLQRTATIQIGIPGGPGVSLSGLRVRFHVEMSRTSTADEAVITIWNPSANTVGLLNIDGVAVRVFAGYESSVPLQVFYGKPVKGGVHQERQGPTRVVTIEAQDGGDRLRDSRVELSYQTPTSLSTIVQACIAALQLPPGTVTLPSDPTLTQGFVYAGSASKLLDRIAISIGADWFIRDGAINLIGQGDSTGEPPDSVVFSSQSGNLVGTPIRMDRGRVQVVGLLQPNLRPGMRYRVYSEEITGDFVAEDVTQDGDSEGEENDWYTTAVGRPLAA
jgi:hypothetical protein